MPSIRKILGELEEERGYTEIKELLSEYLKEKGFVIADAGSPTEIHTSKNGVNIKTIIRKTTVLLCKNNIVVNLYDPDSLQEIAAVLLVCHLGKGNCKRCAFPAIERSSKSEVWKFLREMQEK